MKHLVYIIEEPDLIEYIDEGDVEGFREALAEGADYYAFDEPEEFDTEAEALAFCAGLGYGDDDERRPPEVWPLRSFEPLDAPYIEAIRAFVEGED